MATFITSKSVGQDINIDVQTSTGYWKYNHNGSDSSVFFDGGQTITVANANGEFTIIPCLSDGTVSGDLTYLDLSGGKNGDNQLTSFDGTGLSSLTYLGLNGNQLTSFDGTGLTSLTILQLQGNQLTSFDGTGLTSLTILQLQGNQLTSLSGFVFPTSLTILSLNHNQLTSLSGFVFPTSLTDLDLSGNQLTSFDGTGLTSLNYLYLNDNLLTSSSNNQILNLLDQYGLENGEFYTTGGRTSAGTADYDALIAKGWNLLGLDLTGGGGGGVNVTGKLRIKGATTIG